MDYDKNEAIFPISVASKMLHVTTKMLRIYEEQGFLTPARTKGTSKIKGRRFYSQNDIEYINCLRTLMQKGFSLENLKVIYEFTKNIAPDKVNSKEDFYMSMKNYLNKSFLK